MRAHGHAMPWLAGFALPGPCPFASSGALSCALQLAVTLSATGQRHVASYGTEVKVSTWGQAIFLLPGSWNTNSVTGSVGDFEMVPSFVDGARHLLTTKQGNLLFSQSVTFEASDCSRSIYRSCKSII